MSLSVVNAPVRFHLSLNVADLGRSVAFYRILFGREPAKQRADYAKFELEDPPVVLSLEPHAPGHGGALNHLGFRLPDAATLVEMQRRLETGGIRSEREEGVECCYARQTKFWVHDPDRTLWEFYVLEGDIEHRGAGQVPERVLPAESAQPQGVARDWEHRLGMPFPERLPFEDGSLDEVRLRGTFNVPAAASQAREWLAESLRVLRPGGQLLVHCLTCDRPTTEAPQLPGLASMVQHTPQDRALVAELEEAGFAAIRLTKFGASPCFTVGGVEMRETLIHAAKPVSAAGAATHTVVYRGPFREVTDDAGHTWRRGERRQISEAIWNALRQEPLAEHFTCLEMPSPEPVACAAGMSGAEVSPWGVSGDEVAHCQT